MDSDFEENETDLPTSSGLQVSGALVLPARVKVLLTLHHSLVLMGRFKRYDSLYW